MTQVRIIGVPMDLGASRRGVDMGPSAVRYTDLRERLVKLGHDVDDAGNVPVPLREDAARGAQRGARYLGAITDVCTAVAAQTREALASGRMPVVLGGDHALAAGSIAGAASHLRAKGQRIGALWVDAHGDLNTPATSKSGNVHGMPLAALLGFGDKAMVELAGAAPALRTSDLALVGLRDLDAAERTHIKKWKLSAFTMRALDERGVRSVLEEAIAVATKDTSGLWVSFDMDVIDPEEAPGVGTAVPGGMTYREAHLAMEMIADTGKLVGLDMVEVNPVLDERNRTAEIACELICSALGKRIL
ncbi:arginase [Pseudogemmatithrix spongiicola]|uniref:Arginase n=1 Tax=Pseudogemmatithrix spongiicola TaxID=3062599 RepID=A0AA49K2F7_9BACT|nr:arginase [Gemmatimonadaceae bacterium 'strain 138']WKW16157.1 arginase [Gemmatimonadaceae bacterium 'strain 318']